MQRYEHVILDQIGHYRRNGHDERDGRPHAHGGTYPARHAQERADAQKLRQDDVIDENGGYDYDEIFHDYPCLCLAVSLLKIVIR